MRRSYITILFLLVCLHGKAQHLSDRKIARQIKRIEAFQNSTVAIAVNKINKTKPTVSFNDATYMTPASNTKLLTFLGAVQHFDSLPRLEYYKENDSITHIRSTGYPLLLHPLYEDTDLTAFLKNQQNVVYHPEKHPIERFGKGWSWDDYPYYYSAETSSFPIYGNVIRIQMDSLASVHSIHPEHFNTRLIKDTLGHFPKFERLEHRNQFQMNPKKWDLSPKPFTPFRTGDSLFVTLLSKAIQRPVRFAQTAQLPNLWKTNHTSDSDPLYQALLQDSDNLIAEMLLLMIAKKRTDTLHTGKAIDMLKTDWHSFIPDPLEWVDGSGLSRYNMFTSRSLVAVLQQIHDVIGMEKIKTLFPSKTVYGIKSDPRGRLDSYVYAKTGTLRHNLCLSGYLIGRKNTPYVFSIMVNHATAPNLKIRQGIGSLLAYLRKKL